MERAATGRSCSAAACFSGRQLASLPKVQLHRLACKRSTGSPWRNQIICSAIEGNLNPSRFPGFFEEEILGEPEPSIITPESASWGLSTSQMRALGITNDTQTRRQLDPVRKPRLNINQFKIPPEYNTAEKDSCVDRLQVSW